jgi:DNA-binding MarR family transcriptional regulator
MTLASLLGLRTVRMPYQEMLEADGVPLPEPVPPVRLSPVAPGSPGSSRPHEDASPRPGPLTDPQDTVLAILRMARALDGVDAGLSPQQYRILKLAGAGGERSARLAERLAVAKPTLTAIADSLVAAGLARREAEPGDRRVVRLHLTEAGIAAVERADAAYGQWLAHVLELTGRGDEIQDDLGLMIGALDELRRRKKAAAAGAGLTPGTEPAAASRTSTRTGATTSTESSTAVTTRPAPSATPTAPSTGITSAGRP